MKDRKKSIKVGDKELDLSTPAVMTILNVTPDSFFGPSRRVSPADIAACAAQAVKDGASIIDVGGYSSRPGAAVVSPDEEFSRIARGMEIVRRNHPDVIISVDTFRASVARRVVESFGPVIVNDISAGELDPEMTATVSGLGVPYVVMHMRGRPENMQEREFTQYDDIAGEVKAFFIKKIAELQAAGIKDIIIDPGFGFAKTTRQNYQLFRHMSGLAELGYPILAGVSRKSMIYTVLGGGPEKALAGTCALNWEALRAGASIIRVHDTREAADIIKLYNYYVEADEQK